MSAQHPHSQFRSSETRIDREVAPGANAAVTLPVRFSESPSAIVENPFLILRFSDGTEWRLLARVRVTAGPSGEPLAGPAVVTTMQQVGGPD